MKKIVLVLREVTIGRGRVQGVEAIPGIGTVKRVLNGKFYMRFWLIFYANLCPPKCTTHTHKNIYTIRLKNNNSSYHLLSLLFARHYTECIICIIAFNPNYNLMRQILCIISISQLRKLKLGQDKSINKEDKSGTVPKSVWLQSSCF